MVDLGFVGRSNFTKESMAILSRMDEKASSPGNSTKEIISNLVFMENKSLRTSTLILAIFNVIAAFATISSILYDCYWASKRKTPELKAKKFFISAIHPAETFPLIIAAGSLIQGTVFICAQNAGIQSTFIDGCSLIAQFMFPALFLVPYIQLVFGLECAFRSLRKYPFHQRGKYDVSICVGVIVLMLIGTWIPTNLFPQNDHCSASLLWFVTRYGTLGLVLNATVLGLVTISAAVIFYRLTKVTKVDPWQRIAASRMVYYLILAIVTLSLVIPWFVTLTLQNPTVLTGMMATVVVNLNGLMTGLLQLCLRSNTTNTSFRPNGMSGWSRKKHELRIWGPNKLGFDGHRMKSASGPQRPTSMSSRISLVNPEKNRDLSMETIRNPTYVLSPPMVNQLASNGIDGARMPLAPEPAITIMAPSRSNSRGPKTSYSLFPGGPPVPTKPSLPTSIFSTSRAQAFQTDTLISLYPSTPRDDVDSAYLEPPPSLDFLDANSSNRHRRDSSMVSSATVQIGLRISHMDDQSPTLPPSAYQFHLPRSPFLAVPAQNLVPAPLVLSTALPKNSSLKIPEDDARMKTLPPTPRSTDSTILVPRPRQLHLSPAVYSPVNAETGRTQATSSTDHRTNRTAPPEDLGSRASKVDWI